MIDGDGFAHGGRPGNHVGTSAISVVVARLDGLNTQWLAAGDPRHYFCGTYLRTTVAIGDEIRRSGFEDGAWLERWDVAFAELYLEAVECWDRTGDAPGPWAIAFAAAADPGVQPLRHVLLGLNAHINFDLAPSIVSVMTPADFDDPTTVTSRRKDCRHVDDVLAARVPAEDRELARLEPPGSRTVLDRMLTPFNRLGTKRFLAESREKVWRNACRLDQARRIDPDAYDATLSELGNLARARVIDLRRPGQVLLRLARHGFGVELA
jgi:hypothetical protein